MPTTPQVRPRLSGAAWTWCGPRAGRSTWSPPWGANEEKPTDLPEEFRYTHIGAGATDWLHGQVRITAEREHVHVETHPVLADPVDAITRVAAEEEADLIIVGSRDHHGTRQLSGVPKGVMDRASCAVLVV